MPVVPADAQAWRVLLHHFLDDTDPGRLSHLLRLEADRVSDLGFHALATLLPGGLEWQTGYAALRAGSPK